MNSEEFKTSEEVRDNWDKKQEEYWSKKAKLSTTLKDIFTTESNEGVRFSLGDKKGIDTHLAAITQKSNPTENDGHVNSNTNIDNRIEVTSESLENLSDLDCR